MRDCRSPLVMHALRRRVCQAEEMDWAVDRDLMTVNYLGPVALTKVPPLRRGLRVGPLSCRLRRCGPSPSPSPVQGRPRGRPCSRVCGARVRG